MTQTISVLMPVASVDTFVTAAINSVLAQKVELELLLIGAPAHTESWRVLNEMIALQYPQNSRIRMVARDKPGIVNALNSGLKVAGGDFIARMDADDISHKNRLREQLNCALAQETSCLVSACVDIFSDTLDIRAGNKRYQHWLNSHCSQPALRQACFVESPLPHPTWFAHRSIWDRLGQYQSGDFPEDYDMVLRAWLQGIAMVKPPSVLLRWREHENRLTHTDKRYRREAFTQLKAQAVMDVRSGLQVHTGRPVWIAGTGRNARNWHDALARQNADIRGFLDIEHPGVRQQFRGKPVIRYPDFIKCRGDALLVTAVTDDKARAELRHWFAEHGMVPGRDVILGG